MLKLNFAAAASALFCLSACAVPQFDVPYYDKGPDASSIVSRIQCEMREMVAYDKSNPRSYNSDFLLNNDYDLAVTLSLDVNNTGGLSPSLSYLTPLAVPAKFAFSGAGTFSEGRQHNFTSNLQLSFRQIYLDWLHDKGDYPCPVADTNLAGELGISDFVNLAARMPTLNQDKTPFGGSIQFLVTKNVNSLGPTWTLTHFVGPGSVNLSSVNTDKVTLAFARGPNVGKPLTAASNATNRLANEFIQQLLLGQISTQLSTPQISTPAPSLFPFIFTHP